MLGSGIYDARPRLLGWGTKFERATVAARRTGAAHWHEYLLTPTVKTRDGGTIANLILSKHE